MTHPEMNELYELYLLGTLEPELAREIEAHVIDQCEYCGERLREAAMVVAAMSGMAEQLEPPKHLRERVLASVRPRKQSICWIYAVAGLAAACVLLLAYALWSTNTSRSLREEIAALTQERDQLRSAVEVLSRPDTRMVQFGKENAARGQSVPEPEWRSGIRRLATAATGQRQDVSVMVDPRQRCAALGRTISRERTGRFRERSARPAEFGADPSSGG